MMGQSLKLFLNIWLCTTLACACESRANGYNNPPKRQLVVIVDKSRSVTYTNKLGDIKTWLSQQFKEAYASSFVDIQYSMFLVDKDTRVFPKTELFEDKCDNPNPETRSEQLKLSRWQDNRRRWINGQVSNILKLIQQQPTSKHTDIFSIFEGLEEVQKTNGPWDVLDILFFSDMIHTADQSMKSLTADNAFMKGKEACQRLIQQGRIKKGNTAKFRFFIYTPDNLQESTNVYLFWKGFFSQWGVGNHQYQFKS